MALDLSPPRTDKLARSPLRLVVCQVRHETKDEVSQPTVGAEIRERLKASFPVLEQQIMKELSIAIDQGVGVGPSAEHRGWKLRALDQTSHVSVMPDAYALEMTRYDDWDDFRARFEMLTAAIEETVHPSLEQRVGIRFVDQIKHPSVRTAHDWTRLIEPAFLGPLSHKVLGSAVTSAQQVVHFDVGDGISITLRHGTVHDPDQSRPAYLLDQDCFVHKGRPFNTKDVLQLIDELHTVALQVFQAAMTEDLYQYLKG